MKPTMAAFIRHADEPTARETGRLLLVLAALLRASGRARDADRTLRCAITFLEQALTRSST